ncbi:MAG: four helix bundle protein [Patescibacteria group bacterium]
MKLEDLEIYVLACEIGKDAWDVYTKMDWQTKKVIGDQFVTAVDSIAANVAEGFGRFHYADKNKFNYNARGSLLESFHWINTLATRDFINENESVKFKGKLDRLGIKLNNYISSTRNQIGN